MSENHQYLFCFLLIFVVVKMIWKQSLFCIIFAVWCAHLDTWLFHLSNLWAMKCSPKNTNRGVRTISPTLQESQNKIFTIVWPDFVYWFQLFIIQICTLMDDSTFANRKSSLRAFIWCIYLHFTKNVTYALSGSHPSKYKNQTTFKNIDRQQAFLHSRALCVPRLSTSRQLLVSSPISPQNLADIDLCTYNDSGKHKQTVGATHAHLQTRAPTSLTTIHRVEDPKRTEKDSQTVWML